MCARSSWLSDGKGGTRHGAACRSQSFASPSRRPGAHWVSNSLAVLAAVDAVGGDLPAAGLALAEMAGLTGRGARHHVPVGGGQILVIDESYNANPAVDGGDDRPTRQRSGDRRIAILGAMRELGAGSDAIMPGLRLRSSQAGCNSPCLSAKRWRRWPKRLRAASISSMWPRRRPR
jgi:UDP-N-acetylmuramoyl-tripeptide--D-alanyl-D-alanine ligase